MAYPPISNITVGPEYLFNHQCNRLQTLGGSKRGLVLIPRQFSGSSEPSCRRSYRTRRGHRKSTIFSRRIEGRPWRQDIFRCWQLQPAPSGRNRQSHHRQRVQGLTVRWGGRQDHPMCRWMQRRNWWNRNNMQQHLQNIISPPIMVRFRQLIAIIQRKLHYEQHCNEECLDQTIIDGATCVVMEK